MGLLHIYDADDWRIRSTANRSDSSCRVGVTSGDLAASLDPLLSLGRIYDRILFETHGSPGTIYFGDNSFDADWFRSVIPRGYSRLAIRNARVYFNGCNVADGKEGWRFLEAAAALFLTPGGGQVFGQTSIGFSNLFNGHVVHLWGRTRTLFVDANGRILERFAQ
ncbi:hypothetical protein [Bradyrhizobium prioriisuperbiae]|uniref:hypothetical protein n=1 Tax=Bradyrhizobium prioriisuperbiae TaxID=2854389 RepID=UPI0028E91440|nr:hypothetical protein [Bradyrhizobium prioritasuperba]